MSQSLAGLYVHIIFHIKKEGIEIAKEESKDLYAYIGAIIKENESIPIKINGTHDHIHVLCLMSKNIALSKLLEEIKRHSSRWIKTKGEQYKQFAWQGGYGAFSVSPSICEKTKQYIENQEEHHRRTTFREEYLMFLKEYNIAYNE